MKIAFHTLGCKVNQFDTALMKDQAFQKIHEIVSFDELSDIYVINTCSVTGKSDIQSRQLVRQAKRKNPQARVIVTGCFAQTNPEAISEIPGVDVILGNQEKGDWLDYLGGCEQGLLSTNVNKAFPRGPLEQPLIHHFAERTRAFLKIQDGCDARCSFCLIPRARGPSRSVPFTRVIEQVRLLSMNGYSEVVLTGVNLGFYGRDVQPKKTLSTLLSRLLVETNIPRIRLSSVEPKTVTGELIDLVASSPRVCNHFHVPLQSGDKDILKSMNRHYSPIFYRRLIEKIHDRIPQCSIGIDVMVGFPGESERQFKNTYDLLKNLPLSYLHVFPFSKRPQTKAERFEDQVSANVKKVRSEKLRELSLEKQSSFYSSHIGKQLDILVEDERDPSNLLRGFTDNYIRVGIDGPDRWKNQLIPVILSSLRPPGVLAFPAALPVIDSNPTPIKPLADSVSRNGSGATRDRTGLDMSRSK